LNHTKPKRDWLRSDSEGACTLYASDLQQTKVRTDELNYENEKNEPDFIVLNMTALFLLKNFVEVSR